MEQRGDASTSRARAPDTRVPVQKERKPILPPSARPAPPPPRAPPASQPVRLPTMGLDEFLAQLPAVLDQLRREPPSGPLQPTANQNVLYPGPRQWNRFFEAIMLPALPPTLLHHSLFALSLHKTPSRRIAQCVQGYQPRVASLQPSTAASYMTAIGQGELSSLEKLVWFKFKKDLFAREKEESHALDSESRSNQQSTESRKILNPLAVPLTKAATASAVPATTAAVLSGSDVAARKTIPAETSSAPSPLVALPHPFPPTSSSTTREASSTSIASPSAPVAPARPDPAVLPTPTSSPASDVPSVARRASLRKKEGKRSYSMVSETGEQLRKLSQPFVSSDEEENPHEPFAMNDASAMALVLMAPFDESSKMEMDAAMGSFVNDTSTGCAVDVVNRRPRVVPTTWEELSLVTEGFEDDLVPNSPNALAVSQGAILRSLDELEQALSGGPMEVSGVDRGESGEGRREYAFVVDSWDSLHLIMQQLV